MCLMVTITIQICMVMDITTITHFSDKFYKKTNHNV